MSLKLTVLLCIASVALSFLAVAIFAQQPAAKDQSAALKDQGTVLSDSTRAALQTEVMTIVMQNCGCHTGKRPDAKMLLAPAALLKSTVNVPSREIPSLMRVDPQYPEKSYLLMKIRGEKGIKGKRMPRGAAPLTSEDIQAIESWIASLSTTENPEQK